MRLCLCALAIRVVLAEDNYLVREGVRRLAQGKSNAAALVITERSVEKVIHSTAGCDQRVQLVPAAVGDTE